MPASLSRKSPSTAKHPLTSRSVALLAVTLSPSTKGEDSDQLVAYWTGRLPAFTALTRLAFATVSSFTFALESDVAAILAAVPSQLEVLRLPPMVDTTIASPLVVMACMLRVLECDLPCLKKLRRLIFSVAVETAAALEADQVSQFMMKHLKERCTELRIELVERKRVLVGDASDLASSDVLVEDWETYDEGW